MLKIDEISKLTGLSKRSIRFYESKSLLVPKRSNANYRLYDEHDIVKLYLIRFLKELDFPLDSIKEILMENHTNETILKTYLATLQKDINRKKKIVREVKKIIQNEQDMTDSNAFSKFKKGLVERNETTYGDEVKKTYSTESFEESNERVLALSKREYKDAQSLSDAIKEMLKILIQDDVSPASKQGYVLGKMHHKWLMYYWKTYSKTAHLGLANTYVEDKRFSKYYEDTVPGGAKYMREAIMYYVNNQK